MPSLPPEFRCFQHVDCIFARNLPLEDSFDGARKIANYDAKAQPLDVQAHIPIGQGSQNSSELTSESQTLFRNPTNSIDNVVHSIGEEDFRKCTGTPPRRTEPDGFLRYPAHPCISSYYVLRDPKASEPSYTDGRLTQDDKGVCYESEIYANSTNPTWDCIPLIVRLSYATHTKFVLEVYYFSQDGLDTSWSPTPEDCAPSSDSNTAQLSSHCLSWSRHHPNRQRDRCVCRRLLDTTRLRYVAQSMSEVAQHTPDALTKNSLDYTVFFVKCFDGIFVLSSEPNTSPHIGSVTLGKANVPWFRLEGDSRCHIATESFLNTTSVNVGISPCSESPSHGRMPSNALRGVLSLRDLKSLAIATVTWQNIHGTMLERRKELLDEIDAEEESYETEAAACVMQATLRAQVSHFNEQLTFAMLTAEQLRAQVEEKERILDRYDRVLSLLEKSNVLMNQAQLQRARSEERQKLHRTELLVKLARSRQGLVLQLASIYHVELGVQYLGSSANRNKITDAINGIPLPLFTDHLIDARRSFSSPTSQASPQEMYDESLALGYAAHAVQTLAIIYGIVLPFPLLVAGAQSRILVRPDLSPDLVVSACTSCSDTKLPLYYQSVANRPMMQAAVNLLLYDITTITEAIGKNVATVRGFGLRLGAALDYVLSDK